MASFGIPKSQGIAVTFMPNLIKIRRTTIKLSSFPCTHMCLSWCCCFWRSPMWSTALKHRCWLKQNKAEKLSSNDFFTLLVSSSIVTPLNEAIWMDPKAVCVWFQREIQITNTPLLRACICVWVFFSPPWCSHYWSWSVGLVCSYR